MTRAFSRLSIGALSFAVALTAHAQYFVKNLVSDGFTQAVTIDPNLVNPWGIAFGPTGPFWIANNGPSNSTLYNSAGMPFPLGNPLVVNVPPTDSAPTGLVFNEGLGDLQRGFFHCDQPLASTGSGAVVTMRGFSMYIS